MHLPDGLMPLRQTAPLVAVAGGVVAVASLRLKATLAQSRLPLVGFLAAVVVVLQMLNFPIVGSASAHLIGTTLVVFVAGVEAGALAMASVLLLQAVLLQDGGILALGANYLDIVAFPILVAAIALRFVTARSSPRRIAFAGAAAAWFGSVAGSAACAVQLWAAHVVPLRPALAWLVGCHALVGLVEAALTGAALASLAAKRQLAMHRTDPVDVAVPARRWFVPMVCVAVVLALLVPFASRRPDTLESLLHRIHP